jgi:hypothetical protein
VASVGRLTVAKEGREVLDPCTKLTGGDGHVVSVEWGKDEYALSEELGNGPGHARKALHEKVGAMCAEKGKRGTGAIRGVCPWIIVVQHIDQDDAKTPDVAPLGAVGRSYIITALKAHVGCAPTVHVGAFNLVGA